MKPRNSSLVITGRPVSPGLAEGNTFVHREALQALDVPTPIESDEIELEFNRLEEAKASITRDLLVLSGRVEKEMDARLAAVFGAHQLMLNDPAIMQELRAEIRQNMVSAGSAVKAVFLRWEKRFLLMESQVARHKADDMRDISIRLSKALAGTILHPLEKVPDGSVLVASRLLPSDMVFLSRHALSGVLLEFGGAGSHAALFVREMGVPCIGEIANVLDRVPVGATVLVDAHAGEVIVHPQVSDWKRFHAKVEDVLRTSAVARSRSQEPAVTKDGVDISVFANVGCRADTERAMENGADGIGLYRTEHAYLGRATPPGVDELVEEMRHTLEPAQGKPICVRLLDVGADKQLPYVGFLAESNPALGRRGIRLLREFPKLLETQLQALVALARELDLRLLIPMVSVGEDVTFVRSMLKRIGAESGNVDLPPLGVMVETPGAALSILGFRKQVDFFSIGTNDLTQYAFAVDRDNAAVEAYFNDKAEAIYRLIRIVCRGAGGLPVSVCGELAGREEAVTKLLRCGIRILSVAPPLVPTIKEAIRVSRVLPR